MTGDPERKITDALERQLVAPPDVPLDVIVELAPDPVGSSATAAEMKESFEKAAAPVNEAIARKGGEVVDSVWLNRTLHAKVPAANVRDLTGLEEVAALDSPRPIEPE
ncbi:MAG TPA: hypothetical protein VFU16_00875 [Solirubrobacterales bacterium]|nr:hypothetical protein [Solirubrobacterales bacterium]